MKFSQYFESHQIPEWSSQYVRYKRLTKVLKLLELERATSLRRQRTNQAHLEEENFDRNKKVHQLQANATNVTSAGTDNSSDVDLHLRMPGSQPGPSSAPQSSAALLSSNSSFFSPNIHHRSFNLTPAQKKELDALRAQQKLDRESQSLCSDNSELDLKVGQDWIQKSHAIVTARERQLEEQKRAEKEGREPRRMSQLNLHAMEKESQKPEPQVTTSATENFHSSAVLPPTNMDRVSPVAPPFAIEPQAHVAHGTSEMREGKFARKLSEYIPPAIVATFNKGELAFFKLLEEDLETINHFFLKQEEYFLDQLNIIVEQLDRLVNKEKEMEEADELRMQSNVNARQAANNVQAKREGDSQMAKKRPANPLHSSHGHLKDQTILDSFRVCGDTDDSQAQPPPSQLLDASRASLERGIDPTILLSDTRIGNAGDADATTPQSSVASPIFHNDGNDNGEDSRQTASVEMGALRCFDRDLRGAAVEEICRSNAGVETGHHGSPVSVKNAQQRVSPNGEASNSNQTNYSLSHSLRETLHMHFHLKLRLMTAAKPWKVLEKALIELYRGLHLLRSYKIVNLTAFVKILRKYDNLGFHPRLLSRTHRVPLNTCRTPEEFARNGWKAVGQLLPPIEATHFSASPILGAFIRRVESIFASVFTEGDRKLAHDNLSVVQPPIKRQVRFALGLLLGISGIMFLLLIIMIGWIAGSVQPNIRTHLGATLPVWRGIGIAICAIWGWGINVYLFHKYRINHEFILEIDPRKELNFDTVMLIAASLTVIWFILLDSYLFVSLAQSANIWAGAKPGFFPFILFVVCLILILMPFNTFFHSTRCYIFQTLGRIIAAPFFSVRFKDFYWADQLCSMMNVVNDLVYSFCYLFSDHFLSNDSTDDQCLSAQNNAAWLFALLPYWLRVLQCLRKYRDDPPANTRQIWNAGRYFVTICMTLLALLNKSYPNTAFRPIWIAVAASASCYNYAWDLYCDWGFLHHEGGNTRRWLRRKLVLRNHVPYYFAIFSNFFLRVSWVFSNYPFHFGGTQNNDFNSLIWFLEVLRRQQWNFYRVEHEHMTNSENYRFANNVPLKMLHLPNTEEAPEKMENRPPLDATSERKSLNDHSRLNAAGASTGESAAQRPDKIDQESAVAPLQSNVADETTLDASHDEPSAPLLPIMRNRLSGQGSNVSNYNGQFLTAPHARNLNPDRHDDPSLHDLTFHLDEAEAVITSITRQPDDSRPEEMIEPFRIHVSPDEELAPHSTRPVGSDSAISRTSASESDTELAGHEPASTNRHEDAWKRRVHFEAIAHDAPRSAHTTLMRTSTAASTLAHWKRFHHTPRTYSQARAEIHPSTSIIHRTRSLTATHHPEAIMQTEDEDLLQAHASTISNAPATGNSQRNYAPEMVTEADNPFHKRNEVADDVFDRALARRQSTIHLSDPNMHSVSQALSGIIGEEAMKQMVQFRITEQL